MLRQRNPNHGNGKLYIIILDVMTERIKYCIHIVHQNIFEPPTYDISKQYFIDIIYWDIVEHPTHGVHFAQHHLTQAFIYMKCIGSKK